MAEIEAHCTSGWLSAASSSASAMTWVCTHTPAVCAELPGLLLGIPDFQSQFWAAPATKSGNIMGFLAPGQQEALFAQAQAAFLTKALTPGPQVQVPLLVL